MVCIRCKMVVKDELTKPGLHYTLVELGEADIIEIITDELREEIRGCIAKIRTGVDGR
jgi:hypothetical protein